MVQSVDKPILMTLISSTTTISVEVVLKDVTVAQVSPQKIVLHAMSDIGGTQLLPLVTCAS